MQLEHGASTWGTDLRLSLSARSDGRGDRGIIVRWTKSPFERGPGDRPAHSRPCAPSRPLAPLLHPGARRAGPVRLRRAGRRRTPPERITRARPRAGRRGNPPVGVRRRRSLHLMVLLGSEGPVRRAARRALWVAGVRLRPPGRNRSPRRVAAAAVMKGGDARQVTAIGRWVAHCPRGTEPFSGAHAPYAAGQAPTVTPCRSYGPSVVTTSGRLMVDAEGTRTLPTWTNQPLVTCSMWSELQPWLASGQCKRNSTP